MYTTTITERGAEMKEKHYDEEDVVDIAFMIIITIIVLIINLICIYISNAFSHYDEKRGKKIGHHTYT